MLPLFPYSRQPDVPYKKAGAPMSRVGPDSSVPPTPGPGIARSAGLDNGTDMSGLMSKASLGEGVNGSPVKKSAPNGINGSLSRPGTSGPGSPLTRTFTTHNYENPGLVSTFQAKPGYKQWVAQAGTLVADLLTCAGADHIVCSACIIWHVLLCVICIANSLRRSPCMYCTGAAGAVQQQLPFPLIMLPALGLRHGDR